MRIIIAVLVYGALFAWLFVLGVERGDLTLLGASAGGVTVLATMLLLALTSGLRFETWWASHREQIVAGDVLEYGGMLVDGATRVVRFEAQMGLLLGQAQLKSPALVVGIDRVWPTQLVYTLVTAVFGWWSLRGLLLTPVALVKNLTRAESLTLDGLVAGIDPGQFAELRPDDAEALQL